MKKNFRKFLSLALVIIMSLSAIAYESIGEGSIGGIEPMEACNHIFEEHIETKDGVHTYGCTLCYSAVMGEYCYVDCENHSGEFDATCDVCGITWFYDIHEYNCVKKPLNRHNYECTACGDIFAGDISCSPNTMTTYVWKNYILNHGHYLGYLCECGREYREYFYNPSSHANGTDPNCGFCNMSESYTVFDTQA